MTRAPRRRRASGPLEKTEQAHIIQMLTRVGGRVWVTGVPRRKGDFQGAMRTPGLPDVIAFLPRTLGQPGRRLLCVEVKKIGGRLRPEQETFRQECLDASVDHVVGGLDAVIAWLVQTGYVKASEFAHYRQPAAGGAHAAS